VTRRDLRCPNRCPDGRFEALNAPLIVDGSGRYLEHDGSAATYVCAVCHSVAIDVAAAAREMRRDNRSASAVLECPGCGARLLPPEDDPLAPEVECPDCGQRFAVEEGMRSLHGGGSDAEVD
jgi:DNA-directed RNA polymerase subunit RPC12/RpoP